MNKLAIIALTLFSILVIVSCSNDSLTSDVNDTNDKISLSFDEYVSIAYNDIMEITNDEIEGKIKTFYSNFATKTIDSNQCEIRVINKYRINSQDGEIPIVEVMASAENRKDLYVVSADHRFPDILACTQVLDSISINNEGHQLMLKNAEDILLGKLKRYQQVKDSLRNKTLAKITKQLNISKPELTFDDIKHHIMIDNNNQTKSNIVQNPENGQVVLSKIGPFISTEWGNDMPYNNRMGGNCTDWFGDPANYRVSAVVVATAQILGFFEPTISTMGISINWNYLKEAPEIVEPNYFNPGDPFQKRDMVAALMKYCSDRCEVNYTCTGSSYYMSKVISFIKSYGINIDNSQAFNFSLIKTSLDNMKMAICNGRTSENSGHSWLIDGYMVVSTNGDISNANTYVHANMGMGSYYNGYYLVNSNTGLTFNPGFAHFNNSIVMYNNIGK